jgi:EAL domain-containing protein (putative c-di-GMP-specific phosphodiesterase class I)
VFVGGSVGIARATSGDDAAALLRNADVAMYTAKHGGKGRRAVFEREMHSVALERLELEAGLRRALDRGELRLRYQPIVELSTGRAIGAEALLRWQHPERGLLLPAAFLKLCEETGLIVPVGLWVLREACAQGVRWDAALRARSADAAVLPPAFTLSVNVSGRQLQEPGFVADVAAVLAESGLPPDRLLLEITESVFLQQEDVVIERLRALKGLGVRLGIDDFGTGFSSLGYLQRFPLDVLKIDKSFVDGVARGGSDAALARAVIALGEVLSLRTVAEGIARPQQQERLQALGCQFGQGFFFAEPLEAAAVEALLADGPAPESATPAALSMASAPAVEVPPSPPAAPPVEAGPGRIGAPATPPSRRSRKRRRPQD